jgi:phosphatidylserine decarboxylase
MVGALFVGSMATVWHGEVTPRTPRKRSDLPLDASRAPLMLARGAELGRFNMGSTVILLLPPDAGEWRGTLSAGSAVRVGTRLGRLTASLT